jgi:multidrug efflux system membrane fusion protein
VVDSGRVVVINNQVDQTTGTIQLKGEFPNSNVQLWPGQFVNIRVLINTLRQSVVVPTAAVQRGPDNTFVYIVKDDNTVTVRPMMVQQQDDLQAVIASGLMAGERVVTTGFGRLAEGTMVEVTSAEEAGQIATDPAQRPARPGAGAPKGKGDPKGKGQRQQGAPDAPGAAAPPGQAATDPPQPPERRGGGGGGGGQQPAPSPAVSPSTTP